MNWETIREVLASLKISERSSHPAFLTAVMTRVRQHLAAPSWWEAMADLAAQRWRVASALALALFFFTLAAWSMIPPSDESDPVTWLVMENSNATEGWPE